MLVIENENVVKKIESYCRTWRIWLEDIKSGAVIMGDSVFSASSTAQSTSLSDDIELGAVCSAQFTVSIYDTEGGNYLGREFALSLYLKEFDAPPATYADLHRFTYGNLASLTAEQIKQLGEIIGGCLIPMGRFVCVRSKRIDDTCDLTLCDKLYFADKEYVQTASSSRDAMWIEREICAKLGIPNGISYSDRSYLSESSGKRLYAGGKRLKTRSYKFTMDNIPKGTTMRQVLGYIASANGQFGMIDRYGRYVRKWYGSPVKLLDNNTINFPTLSEQANTVVGLICHISEDNTLSRGDVTGRTGRMIEFDNPFMTEELFESLWHRLKGMTWHTAEIDQRLGDPRLDVGDVVVYSDGKSSYNVPITNQSYTYDGGLSANLKAVGISTQEQVYEEVSSNG